MNNDLQAIMARRRRLAESDGNDARGVGGSELELSMSDLQSDYQQYQSGGGMGGGMHGSMTDIGASKAPSAGNDLQSIMERRRRIADGETLEEEEQPAVEEAPPKSALQEIMERRRRIADGEPDPAVLEQQRLEEEAAQQAAAAAQLQLSPYLASPEPPRKGSLQDIMQRRRRLADGEELPSSSIDQKLMTSSTSSGNISPRSSTNVGGVDKLMLAPNIGHQSSSFSNRPGTAPVSATPVKDNLKSVGVTSEMQKIMERRRKLAETTNFVGGDDDDEEEDEDHTEESEPEELLNYKHSHNNDSSAGGGGRQPTLFESPPLHQPPAPQHRNSQPSPYSSYSSPTSPYQTPSIYRSSSSNLASKPNISPSSSSSSSAHLYKMGGGGSGGIAIYSPGQLKPKPTMAVLSPSSPPQSPPQPPMLVSQPPQHVSSPIPSPKPPIQNEAEEEEEATEQQQQPRPASPQDEEEEDEEEKVQAEPTLVRTPETGGAGGSSNRSIPSASVSAKTSHHKSSKASSPGDRQPQEKSTPRAGAATPSKSTQNTAGVASSTSTQNTGALASSGSTAARTKSKRIASKSKKTLSGLAKDQDMKQKQAGKLFSMLSSPKGSEDNDDDAEVQLELEEDVDDTTVASDLPESLASAPEPAKIPSSLLAPAAAGDDEEDEDINFHSEPVPEARVEKKVHRRSVRGSGTIPVAQTETSQGNNETSATTSGNDAAARRTVHKQGSTVSASSSSSTPLEGKLATRRKSGATGDDDASTASSRRKGGKASAGVQPRRKTGTSTTAPVAEEGDEEEDTEMAPVTEIRAGRRRPVAPTSSDEAVSPELRSTTPEDDKISPRRKTRSTAPGAEGQTATRRGGVRPAPTKSVATDDDSDSRLASRPTGGPPAEEDTSASRRGARTTLSKMMEDDAGSRRGPRSVKSSDDDSGSRREGRSIVSMDDESLLSGPKKTGTAKRVKSSKDATDRRSRKPSGKSKEMEGDAPMREPKPSPSLSSTIGATSANARRSRSGDASVTSASSCEDMSNGSAPDDFSKLPLWEIRHQHPGDRDGKIAVFQRGEKGVAAQWSEVTKSWAELGEVTGGSAVGGSSVVQNDDEAQSSRKLRRKSGDSAVASVSSTKSKDTADLRRRRASRSAGEPARPRSKLSLAASSDCSEESVRQKSNRSAEGPSERGDDEEPEDGNETEQEQERPADRPSVSQAARKRPVRKKSSVQSMADDNASSEGKVPVVEDGAARKSFSGFDGGGWESASGFGPEMSVSGADSFTGGAAKGGFSGAFMADFGDTAFEGALEAAPVTFSSDAFKADTNFDDAFGSPSAFDPVGSSNLFAPATTKAQPVYENSPLTGMPTNPMGKLEWVQRTVLRCRFQGSLATNPLNGNIFLCSETRDGALLREVDTSNGNRQVLSSRVLSPELCAMVSNKYNATVRGLDNVARITSGLHQAKGQTRVRVAAMLALRLLETPQLLHVIAVWQWGKGFPQPVSLLYIMSPPSGTDFAFEASSLRIADNLLFLAGQSPKGPCVLISKPSLREAWTSNSLPGTGKISSMEVYMSLDQPRPYVAVALTDKTISVWSYKAAIDLSGSKIKEQESKRWLFPLCRLNSSQIMNALDASSLSADGTPTGKDLKNTGHCTHLAWLGPRNSGSCMLLLSASFQNGLAVFHVGLPVQSDGGNGVKPLSEPTSGSSLSQAPKIWPVVAKRWQGKHEHTMSAWVNLGPQVNPCLSLLLQSGELDQANFVLGIIHIPQFRRGPVTKDRLLPFRILANSLVKIKSQASLLPSAMYGVAFCHSEDHLYHLVPDVLGDSSGTSLSSLWYPIASQPPGLSSIGDPLLEETKTDKDGIIHIHTTWQCERHKSESDGSLYDWARPARRHWICRTIVGDRKSCTIDETREEKATSHFGDGETVLGGASSEVVCEIFDDSLAGVTPVRLIRCPGERELYAVLFRPSLCSKTGGKESIALDATVVAFIDRSESTTVVRPLVARDAVFLPSPPGEPPRGLLLKKDGLGLAYFTWDINERKCNIHKTYRPILGVEDDKNYVECKRVFVSSGASQMSLLAVATRLRDFKTVVVCGELVELTGVGPDDWSKLLPNIVTGRASWLESFEDVLSLAGLEGDDSGYRNFSLVTNRRVLILSSAMEISGECRTRRLSSACLAPLGAFAVAFVSDGKVRYLCCLDGDLSHGTIATLSQNLNVASPLLLAIRQDRIISLSEQMSTRLIEPGQKLDSIFLPAASTKPALLLEPLVANAVSIGGKQNQSTTILRNVVEKFGRMVALAHGENEGIGNLGTGLTSRVFEILGRYGLKHAASWLLTGTVKFDRSANTTILPPWQPVTARIRGALNADAVLHILASGDRELTDYVKDPDAGMAASLPRQSDPVSYISQCLAENSLRDGKSIDALKTLDIVGRESTEAMIVQVSLMLEKEKSRDSSGILKAISGYGGGGRGLPSGDARLPSSLAALVLSQKTAKLRGIELGMTGEEINCWIKPLAPSLQKGARLRRVRQRLIGESDLSKCGDDKDADEDALWNTSCKEAKHIWNEGPEREKDKLLMLDRMEDWLGRRRPVILGKEGASAARDRGALADILNTDDNSFGGKSDLEDDNDGWVDGVGEGRTDEANLSGYFRFSEGESDDSSWRSDGLTDLSPYQIKATIFGRSEGFSLQKSTSSVDEGEPGKVKSLFDLVFEKPGIGALVLPSPRGGSLDLGALHTSDRQARQKCTIEFWYNIPSKLSSGEMVLVRRTLGVSADDYKKVAVASDKEAIMWELAVRSNGELVFRSCGGSTLRSSQKHTPREGDDQTRPDLVQIGKWNHVCVLLSSRGLGLTECAVSMLMMGKVVAESKVSMLPPGFDEDDLDSSANLKDLLHKSSMLFGLSNAPGFRLTELRIWACARSDDDVDSFMREYLNAAEGKKKFKVKIKSKKGATTLGKGNFLTKPGTVGGSGTNAPKGLLSLAPTPKVSLAPQKKEEPENAEAQQTNQEAGFATDFNAFGVAESGSASPQASPEKPAEEEVPLTLWDTALPLSQQVRASAAAALIRGPPATRHFGGNRGGLPDFSGMERFGVGGVAICGSEKTIVWRDNEDPPALTYPIGASGAIVSDQMDDEGSEFLCCFLARDKRMVVFELQSRTVVVELQMTTKLNFWRFLPPEAGENTLCFMLVTPVGGFHWMPLDESPRPQQVWKRGQDLAGKKVVAYEEGGSNGLDGPDILSRVGLIMVTKSTGSSSLELWIVPIAGDSVAVQVSDDVMGGCLCLPPYVDEGPFLPLLVAVLQIEEGIFVNVMSLLEPQRGSVGLGEISVTLEVDLTGFEDVDFEPPALAMGTFPEAICCSLANIVVVLIRRKGLIVAFELEDGDMSLIAREGVDHFVIDAVMRYSAEVGGAEIVMLLADDENSKDGRMVSFCFRSAA